jgi:hypothetical protein
VGCTAQIGWRQQYQCTVLSLAQRKVIQQQHRDVSLASAALGSLIRCVLIPKAVPVIVRACAGGCASRLSKALEADAAV